MKHITEDPFHPQAVGVLPTGSRVYGYPSPESDFDLVVLVTKAAMLELYSVADEVVEYKGTDAALRFGRLNLLCTCDVSVYNTWVSGTQELHARRPVTRHEAMTVMQQHRNKAGIP